jgi:hypothetical protein
VNLFIKEKLIGELGMKVMEKDQPDWHADDGSIARKDLVAINAILFLNKTNIASAAPPDVTPKTGLASSFWEAVAAIPDFGEEQARMKTVAAQPVVVKALAKLVYDFAFSNRRPTNSDIYLKQLLDGVTEIDFSHQNPMWQYFDLTTEQRQQGGLASLANYLPAEDANVNRDIGKFQGGYMRFGAKHNDIYPIIADMIRWRLNLPSRHGPAASKSDDTDVSPSTVAHLTSTERAATIAAVTAPAALKERLDRMTAARIADPAGSN